MYRLIAVAEGVRTETLFCLGVSCQRLLTEMSIQLQYRGTSDGKHRSEWIAMYTLHDICIGVGEAVLKSRQTGIRGKSHR